jgi:hypothetical protein
MIPLPTPPPQVVLLIVIWFLALCRVPERREGRHIVIDGRRVPFGE